MSAPKKERWTADSSSGPAATTSGGTASEAEVRSSGGICLWAGRGRLPRLGGRAGMAAAASGAGAGAAQEKQFPPALLSFFIYNPRFGPREGEVSGAGPRAGVRGWQRAPGRGLPDGVRPGQPRGAPGVVACQSPLTDWPLPDCFVLGVRQGPDNAGRVWLQIPDQCLFTG